MKRVAIIGAGVSGLVAAWQMLRDEPGLAVTLFESSGRIGGIVETVRRDGFVVEMGPDSWVTEKSATRELVEELGLEGELIASNDARRRSMFCLMPYSYPTTWTHTQHTHMSLGRYRAL